MFRVRPPIIKIYYIDYGLSRRVKLKKFLLPSSLFVILSLGVFSGGWLVWQSKFGAANSVAEQTTTTADKLPILLTDDQSQLNVVANWLPVLIEANRHQPTEQENLNKERRQKLQKYLANQGSPLVKDQGALDALLQARNMKMILAISFVEGNFCKHQQYFNCSGIGGSEGFRKYANFGAWVTDFDQLLETRYKDLTVEQFKGYYVQPGSQNWVDGVYQILAELEQNQIE